MRYDLDTNILIDAVEGQAPFPQRARNHLAALEQAEHRFVISELTWTECLVLPFRTGNGPLARDDQRFFLGPNITTVPWTGAAHHRAALSRGIHRHGLADSLHLAVAVEYRLDRFLSNDNRLVGFRDVLLELLP